MTGFTTKAIHTTDRDNPYGSILPPIYTTTTYAQPCDGTEGPYDYQRGGNPTRAALETTLATLEGAKHAFCLPLRNGRHRCRPRYPQGRRNPAAGMPSYGGTYRFATIELPARGVKTRFIGDFTALTDEDFADNVTMVFLESPSNPLLRVSDIAAIAEIAHRNGAIVVVDNTFMTPLLQKPLDLGADISVQSATKYLGRPRRPARRRRRNQRRRARRAPLAPADDHRRNAFAHRLLPLAAGGQDPQAAPDPAAEEHH